MTIATTYFGANGWLLEFDDLRVLVDPWLRGSLSFPPGAWMLKGELPEQRPAPEHLDLLLLTQGLADHAHPESLDLLPTAPHPRARRSRSSRKPRSAATQPASDWFCSGNSSGEKIGV